MRSRRRSTALLAAVLSLAMLGVLAPAPSANALTPGTLRWFGRSIEDYAPYQAQTMCFDHATKGAALLSRWLLARYKGSSSSGIVRSCTAGGRSEHKEGRAFDWHVDHRSARGRAQGLAFLKLALATDRYGNRDAIARRLGIMYIIWNDRIYSASNGFVAQPYRNHGCPSGPLSKCSTTLRHIDHMHISLGWSGARAITSFWDGTVAGVTPPPPPPVLDQRQRPVVTLAVPSNGSGVLSTFSLRAGTRYRLVATGYYRSGSGTTRVADAACSWHRDDDAGWSPQAEGSTSKTAMKLTVNGAAGWRPVRSAGSCDRTHTYVWDLVPGTTRAVTLKVNDPEPWDDRGTMTVRILRAWSPVGGYSTSQPSAAPPPQAPAASKPAGPALSAPETIAVTTAGTVRSAGWLAAGTTYDLTVSGTYDAGDGVVADAECSRTPDGTWRSRRTADPLHPELDSYDLYVDGVDLPDVACRSDHTYSYTFQAARDSRIGLSVWDLVRSDDNGELTVVLAPRAG